MQAALCLHLHQKAHIGAGIRVPDLIIEHKALNCLLQSSPCNKREHGTKDQIDLLPLFVRERLLVPVHIDCSDDDRTRVRIDPDLMHLYVRVSVIVITEDLALTMILIKRALVKLRHALCHAKKFAKLCKRFPKTIMIEAVQILHAVDQLLKMNIILFSLFFCHTQKPP